MILGIDIGTSKVAAVIVDDRRRLRASASRPHGANLPAAAGRCEQDADIMLAAARAVLAELPAALRREVRAIGVTGQMHGLVVLDRQGRPISPLINWQDGRCLEGGYLNELNAHGGVALRAGYGCATLAWLLANGALPGGAGSCCTIHDLLVARLCGLSRPVTDPTDGASWGLFDLRKGTWDAPAVRVAGIPRRLLPEVVPCGARVGKVSPMAAREFGLPAGAAVAAAIGDNQASLLATLGEAQVEVALTLGTGGQASVVMPAPGRPARGKGASASRATCRDLPPVTPTCECRPYPGGRTLLVAASLCGGSAWDWLTRAALRWMSQLGQPAMSRAKVFARLNELAAQARAEGRAGSGLQVSPHFLGERYDTFLRGTIGGIDLENFDLGTLAAALARGIVANLKDMLPAHALAGRRRIVGSGNALRKNPIIQEMAQEVFHLPLELAAGREEAAIGAAINAEGIHR